MSSHIDSPPPPPGDPSIDDLPPGGTLGFLFGDDADRREVLTRFLVDGLRRGARVVYAWDGREAKEVLAWLREAGVDPEAAQARGALALLPASVVCPVAGRGSPEALVRGLEAETRRALDAGFTGLRLTSERGWIQELAGSGRHPRDEAAILTFFQQAPCLSLCQYDRRTVSAELVLEALQVHPWVIVDRTLERNVFATVPDPEAGSLAEARARSWLETLDRRRRSLEELRASEARFRAVAESALEAIVVGDEDGRIVFWNRGAERMLGWTEAEALGRPHDLLVPPEHRESHARSLAAVHATGRTRLAGRSLETEAVAKDGRRVPVEVSPSTWVSGGRRHFSIIMRDVTERKRAARELERLAAATDQALEAVAVADRRGVVRYLNAAFARIFEVEPDRALGRRMTELASAVLRPESYREMVATLQAGRPWHGRLAVDRPGRDTVHLDAAATAYRDAEGRLAGYIGSGRDVSREVSLEAQLRHAQKLEALGRFTGGIAHDFNNLLTVVLSSANYLARSLCSDDPETGLASGDPEVPECIADLQSAAERGAALVRRLLVFSRREEVDLAPVDLAELMADLRKALGRLLPASIEVVVESPPGLPRVLADAGSVEQMLINLATNAGDAMPDGGRLTLRLAQADPEEARAAGAAPGAYLRLSVSDTGVGMDEATRTRAFEPFFTTKPAGKGTGLGLAVIYGLVGQHRGAVRVTSAPGRGSTFDIYLPLSDRDVVEEAPDDRDPLPRGRETLLVVEDEPELRRSTRRVLEGLGYRVLTAEDGVAALEVLRTAAGIDLVLSDAVMPRMGGRRLHAALRAEGFEVPIRFVTGYSDRSGDEETGLEDGVPRLLKPWTRGELARFVRQAFARS